MAIAAWRGALDAGGAWSLEQAITALLEGERTDLTFIACDFSNVDPFAAEVYTITRAIPAGETRTYGAIALQIGDAQLARDVGQALGRNPFPIIVPCHRVIGANGSTYMKRNCGPCGRQASISSGRSSPQSPASSTSSPRNF